ncbi:MAG: sensor histidine kinase [Alphaproteobacteria bacterium]
MKIRSLRLRLLIAATCAILLALAVAGVGLVLLFERHVERRIGAEINTYLDQIAARVQFDENGVTGLDGALADPRFEQVYGGLFWQITDEQTRGLTRSRSLWDTSLALPEDTPPLGVIHVHHIDGPQETRLLSHERRLVFDTGRGERILRLAVAIDRADVRALVEEFAEDVARALMLLAAVLILAGWMQVNVGLKPLSAIRRGLIAIRDGETERLVIDVPLEIAPLVEEVNGLLDVQDTAMQKARDRAADLAHGFKTPLTALLADAKRLRDQGEREIADEIERTATLMRGHIDRELTRSRLRHMGTSARIEVGPVVRGLMDTLKRIPKGDHIEFEADIGPGLVVRAERDDLNDILGNLLENAVQHGCGKVRVRAEQRGPLVRIAVEDDGPGIADSQRRAVIDRGKRLDSSAVGTGLGLAIVSDVLDHYRQVLKLDRSDLGGLKASFELAG